MPWRPHQPRRSPRAAPTPASSRFEPVADAPHRADVTWSRRVGLHLLAQPADVDRHRRRVAIGEAPDVGEQLLAPEGSAWVAHEVGEEVELAGGQRHELTVQPGLMGDRIDLEVAGA